MVEPVGVCGEPPWAWVWAWAWCWPCACGALPSLAARLQGTGSVGEVGGEVGGDYGEQGLGKCSGSSPLDV